MRDLLVKTAWIITYFICWPITRIIRPVKISVDESLFDFEKKPAIFISNHKSPFDAWLLSSALPFRVFLKMLPIRILGKLDGYKDPFTKTLSRLGIIRLIYYIYGVVGIKSDWSFEEKTDPLVDALNHGDTVMIFPEGYLNKKKGISMFRRGVAYLYSKTTAAIIPAAINFDKIPDHTEACRVAIGHETRIPKAKISRESYNDSLYQESCEFLRRKVMSLYRFR